MNKKIIKIAVVGAVIACVLNSLGFCVSAPVREQSYTGVGTSFSVALTTYSWTAVPATSTLSGRTGIKINVPTTLNANVVGVISANASETTISTNTHVIEFIKGNEDRDILVGNGLYLHLLSLHTATETIYGVEFKK